MIVTSELADALLAVAFLFVASLVAGLAVDVIGNALLSPARQQARRVRIGATEWDCYVMRDGSELLLPRGCGETNVHSGEQRDVPAPRYVIRTAPGRWVALSTAKRGGFVQTAVWGDAYRCSLPTANQIARNIAAAGGEAFVEAVTGRGVT